MRRVLLVVLTAAAAGAGCSDRGAGPTGPGTPVPEPVSYAADVQPLFDAGCTGCHGAGGSGGLDLRSPDSLTNLVGVASTNWAGQLVVAEEPDQSVLYLKLTGAGGVGDRMPVGGALAEAEIELVRRWIAEGARDN